MFRRTIALIKKETRELVRDPVYMGLTFIVPIIIMLLFGYGLSMDVKHLPVVFVDYDHSIVSRNYIDSYVHSEYFNLIAVSRSTKKAEQMLKSGKVRVIIEIPIDFSRRITAYRPTSVGVTIDGSFPARANIIAGYIMAINNLYNQQLLHDYMSQQGIRAQNVIPTKMNISIWYNPSLDSKNFIVPGIMVIIMMLFPALLGALLIAREVEMGTIFNLFASPIKRWEILVGKAVPYIGVAFFSYLVMFFMSIWLFQVRFVGSFPVLSLCALLYLVCTIGIGLLISVLTKSQLAAMFITFLVTVTPAFNYSGLLAPVSSQDAVGQFAASLIPSTYFLEIIRGTYLKGLGFSFYWPQLVILGVYAIILYALAWMLLKKRIN